jgi:hypothetical protein
MEIAGTTAREPIGFTKERVTNGAWRMELPYQLFAPPHSPFQPISGIFGLFSSYFALTQEAYGL